MIATFKFEDFLATGKRAGKPHGIHICFATRTDIAQLFSTGHSVYNNFGQLNTKRIVGKECHALTQLFLHCFVHCRMAMAK